MSSCSLTLAPKLSASQFCPLATSVSLPQGHSFLLAWLALQGQVKPVGSRTLGSLFKNTHAASAPTLTRYIKWMKNSYFLKTLKVILTTPAAFKSTWI